ncbi:Nif3-like dinuclear metal center hexameric protein [Adlercreutzia sp. R21]|uniref:GTP cyclohydrolase 1 type 2 homolog n=1 Tax=Adlercreutzia wanghongyangiae TaxID=3111451 RepID=A0ABU6IGM3_9ACTN|nr:Nif3-like dinuclear metal center hexameric protein [Adlercreutzia sp. R21]MEC4175536.1 Nif3-like dinuclear metal center hexameric protein [Adlercreutzia sp. R7]MEC4183386.1 Nif3-like dinuclear metal center hexameric protein [Adlercreutzia sp. R21]
MGLFNKGERAGAPVKKDALSRRGASELAKKSFSLTIGALEQALLKEFPAEDAESWDRTGLLVGERGLPVTKVAVALDPTVQAIEEAAQAGANVLLTHHPAYLAAPDTFAPEPSPALSAGAVVWAAIRHQVALMDFHTALDVSPLAARVLPGMLGLKFTGKFAEPLSSSRRKGYGQICEVPAVDGAPETLGRLAARCTAVFGRAPRVWGAPDAPLRCAVTCTGSAADTGAAALALGADVVVCGEMKYHAALELSRAGLAVIELGHDGSELPLVAVLAEALDKAGVPADAIVLIDQSENWWYPEAVRV